MPTPKHMHDEVNTHTTQTYLETPTWVYIKNEYSL